MTPGEAISAEARDPEVVYNKEVKVRLDIPNLQTGAARGHLDEWPKEASKKPRQKESIGPPTFESVLDVGSGPSNFGSNRCCMILTYL